MESSNNTSLSRPSSNNNFCFENAKKVIFSQPSLKEKITFLAGIILLSLICLLIGAIGSLALLGGYLGILAPLNTVVVSIWKNLPYLMVSVGGLGILIDLGCMVYGVYVLSKMLYNKLQNSPQGALLTNDELDQKKIMNDVSYTIKSLDLMAAYPKIEAYLQKNHRDTFLFINTNPSAKHKEENIEDNHYVFMFYDFETGTIECAHYDTIDDMCLPIVHEHLKTDPKILL